MARLDGVLQRACVFSGFEVGVVFIPGGREGGREGGRGRSRLENRWMFGASAGSVYVSGVLGTHLVGPFVGRLVGWFVRGLLLWVD